MKTFQNDNQRAIVFAALKTLERLSEKDGDLPPGFYQDMTGTKITVTHPQGTQVEIEIAKGCYVERDKGTNGDGSIYKKATQNLYGWSILTLIAKKLIKFNQWAAVREIILEAVKEALANKTSTQAELTLLDDTLANDIAQMRELAIHARKESTPRICKAPILNNTISMKG